MLGLLYEQVDYTMDTLFGAELKRRREVAEMSLEDLHAASGVSPTYLSNIERGNRNPPSEKVILKIASALHWNMNDALKKAGKIPPSEMQEDAVDSLVDQQTYIAAVKNLPLPAVEHLGAFISELLRTNPIGNAMNLSDERVSYERGTNTWYTATGEKITDPIFLREIVSDVTFYHSQPRNGDTAQNETEDSEVNN